MGKKWLSAVKKFFNSESRENRTSEKSEKKLCKSKDSKKNSLDRAEDSKKGESRRAYAAAEVAATSLRAIHGRRREAAAIKIQAAFRGYLARKGTGRMVRLKLMANRRAAKCQTMNTLHSMQTLARVQAHVRERKMRLSEENQALHKQKQLRREKELEKLKLAEDWVDSPHSKEQFEAKLQKKEEAAIRRERTLAYAYSHQWRSNSSRSKKPAFIDPKQQWCWSWPERWMSARPWELSQTLFISGKDYRPRGLNYKAASSRVFSRHAPSTPSSVASNDDMRRLLGFQTEQHRRRHSIGSSLCFGDVERKMTKSRFQVPQNGKPKAKKPLMLASGGRRLSGPPKMAGYGKGWL